MKKIYFALLFTTIFLISFTGFAQNMMVNGDMESWDDPNTPSSWEKAENISQEASEINGGTYSAAHMSASSTKDLTQTVSGIVGGQQYTISYYYKDNDATARTRIWSYWLEGDNTLADNEDVLRPGTYSEENADWQLFTTTLTAPVSADGFRFEVRVYRQDDMTGGYVYYDDFSIVGDQTVYPEPTNYPTAFTATGSGVTITLDWTDAAGEQLPSAYVIKGQEMLTKSADFEAPVDGVPTPDDLDFSDGYAAANVLFGEETFTFSGLDAASGYEFIIYPYTNAGAAIDYKTDGDAPTAMASTDDITILNQEGFENGLGTWTEYSVVGEQIWGTDEFGGQTYAKMSGYAGGSMENEDWLISPQMDWTDFEELYFKFMSASNYDGPALQLFLSQDYDGSGNPNDFEWMEITSEYAWSDGSWNWVASGDGDLVSYDYPAAHLAFKYTSTLEGSATWELDDLMVYGAKTSGIGDNTAKAVSMYPNPATDIVTLQLEEKANVQVISINGQALMQQSLTAGQNQLNTAQLSRGVYFVQIKYEDGSAQNLKLLID